MSDFIFQLDWQAFLIAMIIIELTPGPNMGWLAALSAQYGKRAGVMAVTGVTLGLAIQVMAAAVGLSALIAGFPIIYESLRWAGVIFMLWLAWDAFFETAPTTIDKETYDKGFRRGLIANLLNPKALVFYVAIIGQFTDLSFGAVWWQIIILGSLHLCIAIAVHLAIVILGAKLGDVFEQWRTSLIARLIFAVSLIAIAVWIGVSTG